MSILTNSQLANYSAERIKLYTSLFMLLKKFQEKGRVKTGIKGTSIKRTYHKATGTNFKTIGSGATLDRNENIQEINAEHNWSVYHDNTVFDGIQKQRMGGKYQIVNAVTDRIEKLHTDAEEAFGSQLWTGDGAVFNSAQGQSVIGVENVLTASATSGSYGGISRSANSGFQHLVVDGNGFAGTSFATDCITALLYGKVFAKHPNKGGRTEPDMVFLPKEGIYKLFDKAQKANTYIKKEIGEDYTFWGYNIMVDEFITSTKGFMLNSDTWELMTPNKSLFDLVQSIPQNAVKGTVAFDMLVHCALVCSSPRHNVLISDIDT